MERHQLEDRIRASLHARAEDVQATPHLWEEVSARTSRRARWYLGLWALSGAAAVVAVVFGGMLLLNNPRSVQIEPEPVAPSTAPEETETEATEQPVPGTGPNLQVVTTDGQSLFVVDPSTGEVTRELDPGFGEFVEGAEAAEVAVRPVSDEGVLTVATVIQIEGDWNLEVSVFDAEGTRVDRERMGMGGMDPNGPAPDVVWSEDGRYLMWAGSNAHTQGPPSGPALWAYDWVERPVDDNGLAEPFSVGAPGTAGALFASGGTVDLRTWRGDPLGDSTVFATTSAYEAYRIDLSASTADCEGVEPCPPQFDVRVDPFPFEGSAPVAMDTHGTGATLALVARGEAGVGAENASLSLVVEPMSDLQRELEIPDLTPQGTAGPGDGWMAADDQRVVVGFGPEVHLLTVTGDTVEELAVTDTAALPAGTISADVVAMTRGPAVQPEATPSSPTEEPAADLPAALADDGLPAHVVSHYPSAQEFLLEDRRTPDAPIVTWGRPTGIPAGLQLDEVVVWPGSTPDRLEVVTSWGQGADTRLARAVVQGGAVVSNDAFPEQYQPVSEGPSTATPVFDPNGNHLIWIESAPEGPALRATRWQNGSPSADLGRTPLDGAPPLAELTDWAGTASGSVLTARLADGTTPGMIEIRLLGTEEDQIVLDGAPTRVDLPGPLVDAGSFRSGDTDTRYVVFDDGGLQYALADGLESAVPLGQPEPAAIRIGIFGPDSLTYQATTDGSWYRVQVDDGATSSVSAPGATMAFLPWPES